MLTNLLDLDNNVPVRDVHKEEKSSKRSTGVLNKITSLNIEDGFFNNDTSMGQRKILSPQRESNPWPPRYWLGALTN